MSLERRLSVLEAVQPATAPEHFTITRIIVAPGRPAPVEGQPGVLTTEFTRGYPGGRLVTRRLIQWEDDGSEAAGR